MEDGNLLLQTTTSVLVPSQLNPVNIFTIYLSFFHLLQSLNVVSQVSQIKPLSTSLPHYACHMPNTSLILDIITLIILGVEFKSTFSLLYLFLQRHVNSSLLLNSLDLRSSLQVRNHFPLTHTKQSPNCNALYL
jgi:hypothetical protein